MEYDWNWHHFGQELNWWELCIVNLWQMNKIETGFNLDFPQKWKNPDLLRDTHLNTSQPHLIIWNIYVCTESSELLFNTFFGLKFFRLAFLTNKPYEIFFNRSQSFIYYVEKHSIENEQQCEGKCPGKSKVHKNWCILWSEVPIWWWRWRWRWAKLANNLEILDFDLR